MDLSSTNNASWIQWYHAREFAGDDVMGNDSLAVTAKAELNTKIPTKRRSLC